MFRTRGSYEEGKKGGHGEEEKKMNAAFIVGTVLFAIAFAKARAEGTYVRSLL